MRTTRCCEEGPSRQELGEPRWDTPQSNSIELLAVIGPQRAKRRAAQPVRLLQDRIEHRPEVAGRGIDDLQYLGHRRLSRKSLVALGSAFGKLALQVGIDLLGIG